MGRVARNLKIVMQTAAVLRNRGVPSSMNHRGLSRSAHIVGWPPMQNAHLPHDGM
jgi:hypothetical protein